MLSTPEGVRIPPLIPGSDEWLKRMSASKVAAALGLSPYDSPFSLWHAMAGLLPREEETDEKRRGHYLEPAIAAWFADRHPELVIHPGGCWQHRDRDWQTASPDRLLTVSGTVPTDPATPWQATALLELKSDADGNEWGKPGTDEIPVGHRAQGMTQMDVTGVRRTYFAMIGPYLSFEEYVLDYDAEEAAYIREQAKAFLDSLPGGPREQRPSIDSHTATYEAVRKQHPQIRADDVEITPELARAYCEARRALADSEELERLTKSLMLDALGDAKRARFNGATIAQRQARGDGTPFLVAGRRLPDFSEEAA